MRNKWGNVSAITYDVNEIDWCCSVQVPVQLIEDDHFHAKNLCCWKAASALHQQVFDWCDYLNKWTINLFKWNVCVLLWNIVTVEVRKTHFVLLIDFCSKNQWGDGHAFEVFRLGLQSKSVTFIQCATNYCTSSDQDIQPALTFTVASNLLRTQTPRAKVSEQNSKVSLISRNQIIISWYSDGTMSEPCKHTQSINSVQINYMIRSLRLWTTWTYPPLRTGAFQRRISLARLSCNCFSSRRFSSDPWNFMASWLFRSQEHLKEVRGVNFRVLLFAICTPLNTSSHFYFNSQ